MKSSRIIIWNNKAAEYFRKACEHIQNQSYANAARVKMGIIRIIEDLPKTQRNLLLINSKEIIKGYTEHSKNIHIEFLISILNRKSGF